MRRLPFLLLAALALSACDSGRPSDEPLPSRDDLIAAFGPQAPGEAAVRETGDRPRDYSATAEHHTTVIVGSESTIATFRTVLDGPDALITFIEERTYGDSLQVGSSLAVGVAYGGRGDGGRGNGRLHITSVEGDRISGVFAADLTSSGLLPGAWRVTGAFNATPRSTD